MLLLLTYLTYLVLGSCVFWVLESPAAHDSSKKFQHEKWALLRNFTCLDGPALDSLIRVRGESGRPEHGGAGAAERTGRERKGTARLRSGHRREHFSEIKWKARTRGRLGARLAGWRPESWAGWTRCKEPVLGKRNAQRGALSPRFGARGDPPLPVWRAAWRKHPNLRVTAIGGALTGSRAGGARPGPGSVRTERAAPLGRRREGSIWELRALCRVGQRAKGEGAPMAPSTEDLGANLRPWGGDSRGRWSGLMMSETGSKMVGG